MVTVVVLLDGVGQVRSMMGTLPVGPFGVEALVPRGAPCPPQRDADEGQKYHSEDENSSEKAAQAVMAPRWQRSPLTIGGGKGVHPNAVFAHNGHVKVRAR
jgi:hypothetical protein